MDNGQWAIYKDGFCPSKEPCLSTPVLLLVAFAGGCAFALMGLTYRFAQMRQIAPMHVLVAVSLAGAIWFGLKSWGMPLGSLPPIIWGMAILNGTAQYATIKLITATLKRGPLSPPWCMVNLLFLPVIFWSWIEWHEPLDPWQIAAIVAAVLCVIFAARAQSSPPGQGRKIRANPLFYALLLVALLLLNSLSSVCIKDLGCRYVAAHDPRKMIDVYGNSYFMLMYALLGLCILAETVLGRQYPRRKGLALLLGAIAAGASISGLSAFAACAAYSAAVWAVVAGISGIVVAGVVSVAAFGEKASLNWAGMLLFALLAVLLVAL